MKNQYVVINIGCLECHVSSNLVAVYDTEEAAQAVADTLGEKLYWREGGQNDFQVFTVVHPDEMDEEYASALATEPNR